MTRTALLATTGLATASSFQIDIFAAFKEQIDNRLAGRPATSVAVEAVAGSGKTTTIVAAAKLIPMDWKAVFLAFNAAIAKELDNRLPKHVRGKTLNGLGFMLVIQYLSAIGVRNVDVKANRTYQIMRSLIKNGEMTYAQNDAFGKEVSWLVGMCKSLGVVPVDCTDGVGIDGQQATNEVLNRICMHHERMIDPVFRNEAFNVVRKVLSISFSDQNVIQTNMIDFDDQKWWAVCKRPNGRKLARPLFDVVMVDEVQDVNSVDIELVRMVVKDNGIVVGVGDSNQAIYGFRGADTKAFENFVSSFNAVKLPLSITYRCGKALVRHAQALVPTIQPADHAKEGAVAHLTGYAPSDFQPGDLVMCRNNAPLIEFAFKLIRARVPVIVKGRDIGQNLIRVIRDLMTKKEWVDRKPVFTVPANARVATLTAKLSEWQANQIAMIRAENPDDQGAIERVVDTADALRVFMDANGDGLVSSVMKEIEEMFSDNGKDGQHVVASSIHKAKGLEADRAFMYRPDKLYPFWVAPGTWQYDQERNLDYVARTRGKVFYGYLEPESWGTGWTVADEQIARRAEEDALDFD